MLIDFVCVRLISLIYLLISNCKVVDKKRVVKSKSSKKTEGVKLPMFFSPVRAGFPSPATDFIERKLDLNTLLIKHPASTFFVKVVGDSMINIGIIENDILVVDKSISAVSGDIVIAIIEGEFTVKTLVIQNDKIFLRPENPKYKIIEMGKDKNFEIWGVVTSVIHMVR